jgi:transposase
MDDDTAQAVALHPWAVIAEATSDRLEAQERGALVRAISARPHTHPDGSVRRYSRATIDRWIRAWRRGGLEALKPETRSDTGAVRAHPELADEAEALRLELPTPSAAQISRILYARHGVRVAERTVRGQLARRGLAREALAAEPKAFGRYEADRPNERWITDVLVGPWIPHPKTPRLLCEPSCFCWSMTIRACWSTDVSSRTRTPGRAKTPCAKCPGSAEAVDRCLFGLRVDSAVRYMLGPGTEQVVQLGYREDPLMAGLF